MDVSMAVQELDIPEAIPQSVRSAVLRFFFEHNSRRRE
jgi:hypothetical protein